MHDKPLKVALLGAGGRGRAVLGNWIKLTGCRVTAVVDPSEESLRKAREVLGTGVQGAEFSTDVKGWLRRADADLVTINSWDPQHAENAIDCFKAGLNVQVAKPMAQSTADCDRVVEAWKRSGKLGVVDMQIRCSLLTQKVMELIAAGAVGTVRLIHCLDSVGRSGTEFRHTRSRRRDMIRSWTLAKGVHFLDMCNCFMDDVPVRVFASGARDVFGGDKPNDLRCTDCDEKAECQFEGAKATIGGIPYPVKNSLCVFAKEVDVTDNACAVIDYRRGGRVSYTECYFTPEYQTTYDLIGEKGSIFLRYAMDDRLFIEYRPRGSARVDRYHIYNTDGAHGGGDNRIIRQIAEAIRSGKPMRPDILDGRHAVALCEAIDRSIELRMPVDIPAAPMDR